MARDRLYLLQTAFPDPKLSDGLYFCPFSNQIEGVLASFPALKDAVEIVRLPFPRPRPVVVELLGEENQGLPVLVLGDEKPVPEDAATAAGGLRFVSDTRRILELLAERHGIPRPH